MSICMPVTKTADELEEEENQRIVENRRKAKRKEKGQTDTSSNQRKKKRKTSSDGFICLNPTEYFEESCWITKHKCAWRRQDERRACGEKW